MSSTIHPTAIVHSNAQIGENVTIDPYAVIEEDVILGDGCEIKTHAVVGSGTRMGKGCRVFPGACVGLIPQDLKFENEKTYCFIGDKTTIRECATVNRGTKASGETRVGSNCLFMAYSHVGHDCVLGDTVIMVNSVALAGHVIIGSNVSLGGLVAVHQFTHIGDHVFIGIGAKISQDVAPFALVGNEPTRIAGINRVGLTRRGFTEERMRDIKRAYKILFRDNYSLQNAVVKLNETFPGNPDIDRLISFVKSSTRGLLRMGASVTE